MKYNDGANLDTSEVQDDRGGGGGVSSMGGGAAGLLLGLLFSGRRGKIGTPLIVLAIIGYFAFQFIGGGTSTGSSVLGSLSGSGQAGTADNHEIAKSCKTGQDANNKLECAVVADINSIQDYWSAELPKLGKQYTPVDTVFFTGQTTTACGSATSGSGPFYCPGDRLVYIDLSFYDDLKTQFGAQGGLFVDAYVLAHEYGHHVQDLLGTEAKVRTRSGPKSDSVRLELQADCYAGVWANHATTVPDSSGKPLISDVTNDDISRALDTAGRIGDDYIQKNLGGGSVDQSKFTHGSAAQRQKWFTTGYRTGQPRNCDTFGTDNLG